MTYDLIEDEIFKKFSGDINNVPIIFIIASPRTGSTFVLQLLSKVFEFTYFSNFVNNFFSNHPAIGCLLQKGLDNEKKISFHNSYGETSGLYEPCEATVVLKNWFEWGHPSEINANKAKREKEEHLKKTFSSIYNITKKPIIIKNAWNGYRIEELVKLFKNSYFIWLRRDIVKSSYSDLIARKRKGDPSQVWSSATPKNYRNIQKLHYTEQVVENQYLYNKKVSEDLLKFANERYMEVWYEDLGVDVKNILRLLKKDLEQKLNLPIEISDEELSDIYVEISNKELDNEDFQNIKYYAKKKYSEYLKS